MDRFRLVPGFQENLSPLPVRKASFRLPASTGPSDQKARSPQRPKVVFQLGFLRKLSRQLQLGEYDQHKNTNRYPQRCQQKKHKNKNKGTRKCMYAHTHGRTHTHNRPPVHPPLECGHEAMSLAVKDVILRTTGLSQTRGFRAPRHWAPRHSVARLQVDYPCPILAKLTFVDSPAEIPAARLSPSSTL